MRTDDVAVMLGILAQHSGVETPPTAHVRKRRGKDLGDVLDPGPQLFGLGADKPREPSHLLDQGLEEGILHQSRDRLEVLGVLALVAPRTRARARRTWAGVGLALPFLKPRSSWWLT